MNENDSKVLPPSPQVNLEEEMKRSYLDYAMSVIIGRALPDVRDGLKPVHRRVLYGMWESGNTASRPYKKSARIVGDVMGRYHPHGDTAIYDTVVRMAQGFSMRYPLVDGQGNFGSIDGDNPAAMRYTEVRLTRMAEEMLREDIDKETVPWVANYDGSEQEPEVLPAKIPNLLINGSSGIAVGMATNIPPHNLTEVLAALRLLMERPEADLSELMEVLPGPDFPTAGTIYGMAGIHSAYSTGRGTIHVRAKAHFEEISSDRSAIVVTELPYQVNKARLQEKIAELVRERKIESLSEMRDESDRDGIRLVLELKRGEVPEVVLNTLYKHTQLQVSVGMNLLAIVDNRPQVLTLRQMLLHFLDHRRTVVVRRTRFDLRRAEERAHILEGLLKALDHLDEVIATIRTSQTPAEARDRLMEGFALSRPQAAAILEMRLQRLTGLERDKIVEEYAEVSATIERLRAILGSDDLVLEEIRRELSGIEQRFGDERRTQIVAQEQEITIEDLIADEDMVITVTATGYIKRSPLTLYREQHRGGKGRTGMVTKEGDLVEHLHVASAHSFILVFTDDGLVHWLKVHQLPELSPASRGKALVNLLDLDKDRKVAATMAVRDFQDERFVVFATQRGVVKKTPLSAYARPRVGGIIAIRIDPDDALLSVRMAEPGIDVVLATSRGYAVRFCERGIRPTGRVARGVRGIGLRGEDIVVAMETIQTDGNLLSISEQGYGKRTALREYRRQGRGGLGIINFRVNDKTGPVIALRQVEDDTGMLLITEAGKLIRIQAAGVSLIGRATQGVKVMDLDAEDRLVAAAKIPDRSDDEIEEGAVLEESAVLEDGANSDEGPEAGSDERSATDDSDEDPKVDDPVS